MIRSRLYLCVNGAQAGSTAGRRDTMCPIRYSRSGQKCSTQQIDRNRLCAIPWQERKHSRRQTVSKYDKSKGADNGYPIDPAEGRKKTDNQQKRVRKAKLDRERL